MNNVFIPSHKLRHAVRTIDDRRTFGPSYSHASTMHSTSASGSQPPKKLLRRGKVSENSGNRGSDARGHTVICALDHETHGCASISIVVGRRFTHRLEQARDASARDAAATHAHSPHPVHDHTQRVRAHRRVRIQVRRQAREVLFREVSARTRMQCEEMVRMGTPSLA